MNKLKCLFLLTKHYNLPGDILNIIWCIIKNNSAQIIIDKWYSYLKLSNIEHINRINLCSIYVNNFLYFNTNNRRTCITFEMVSKYLSFNIAFRNKHSSIFWLNIFNSLHYSIINNNYNYNNYNHEYHNRIVNAYYIIRCKLSYKLTC